MQKQALEDAAPVQLSAGMLSDLVGGKPGWSVETEKMRARFASGKLERPLDLQATKAIAQSRKSLYRRWFGKERMHDTFLETLVTHQAIDYAVAGKRIGERFRNPAVLCAGGAQLASFCRLAANVPVLCLISKDV